MKSKDVQNRKPLKTSKLAGVWFIQIIAQITINMKIAIKSIRMIVLPELRTFGFDGAYGKTKTKNHHNNYMQSSRSFVFLMS